MGEIIQYRNKHSSAGQSKLENLEMAISTEKDSSLSLPLLLHVAMF